MLYLIGIGLWDEGDITLKGLEAARMCRKLYLESYTSLWGGNLEKLGLNPEIIQRRGMEDDMQKLIDEAKEEDIGILVPGDALMATTHSALALEARNQGVGIKIIHAASIISALGETGLQIYKFGKIATIPYLETDTPYQILEGNLKCGAHTLFLLDITPERLMSCKEGLKKLLEMEERGKLGLISEDSEVVVFCRAGSSEQLLKFGKIRDFLDFGCTLCVIIAPGKLHFAEKEFLESLR
jgi:diphthine synthase